MLKHPECGKSNLLINNASLEMHYFRRHSSHKGELYKVWKTLKEQWLFSAEEDTGRE